MERHSRRQVLSGLTATAIGATGCIARAPTQQRPAGQGEPRSPPKQLSVEGSVVSQATQDSPLTIRYTLRNEGEDQLTVHSQNKQPFLWVTRLHGEAGNAVLLPPNSDEVWAKSLASTPTNGCWRFVTPAGEDAVVGVETDTGSASIEPGDSYAVTHHVYYEGDEGCFPAGSYSRTTRLGFGGVHDEGPLANVRHTLTFGADGNVDLQVDEPVPCDSPRDCHEAKEATNE